MCEHEDCVCGTGSDQAAITALENCLKQQTNDDALATKHTLATRDGLATSNTLSTSDTLATGDTRATSGSPAPGGQVKPASANARDDEEGGKPDKEGGSDGGQKVWVSELAALLSPGGANRPCLVTKVNTDQFINHKASENGDCAKEHKLHLHDYYEATSLVHFIWL